MFLLVFGVLDFSLALNDYNQLSQLAGQGARAASVNRCPDGTALGACSIQSQLNTTYAQGGMKNNTTINVCLPSGAGVGKPVKVTATYHFRVIPLFQPIVGGGTGINITASQTVRQEIAYTGTTNPCP